MGYNAQFAVTSVAGHVYSRDFPREYKGFQRDASILFDSPTTKKLEK